MSEATYVRLRYLSNAVIKNITDITFRCSFEDFSSYEPYKESTYSYILDEPLRSLPNGVCDTIDFTTGVLTRRVGKIIFNGLENWSVTGYGGHETRNTFEHLLRVTGETAKFNNPVYGYCDKFPYELTNSLPVSDGVRVTINGETDFTNNYFLFCPPTSLIPYRDVTAWKDYLRNNNVTVYYQLNNETTEQLTPEQLKSFDIATHIISDNYLPPTIKTQVPSDFNAVVLGLKSNNEALASQVMSLRQTNDELETTNREQDDVIDVTLLALDEVYGMIDEGEIETMSTGSSMVNVYVKMIKRGIKTLDEVPAKYRAEVEELI